MVNETARLVPAAVLTVTFREPRDANRPRRNLAVIKPGLTTTTLDILTPEPWTAMAAGDVKLVPLRLTDTVAPLLPDDGVMEVSVGAALGGAVTVKVRAAVVPPAVVTVTLREPVLAAAAMVKVALIRVAFTMATLLTLTPDPLTATVAPDEKLVPSSVTGTAAPCAPLAGVTLESVGTDGAAVIDTVAVPTADGDALLAAWTVTVPPAGTLAGAV